MPLAPNSTNENINISYPTKTSKDVTDIEPSHAYIALFNFFLHLKPFSSGVTDVCNERIETNT